MATEIILPSNTPPVTTSTSQPQAHPQPRPQLHPSSSSTTSITAAAKTPVTLHPTAHLDPSAYVRGTHPIQIQSNVLIHPRAHLVSIHAPLTINEGSIIAEKSIVGGPIPPLPSSANTTTNNASTTDTLTPSATTPTETKPIANSNPTSIGNDCHIHPNVQINSGSQIHDYAIIESNVTVNHGVVIGKHSKICAGVTVSRDVPDWTIVYGLNGERRRRRGRTVPSHHRDVGKGDSEHDSSEPKKEEDESKGDGEDVIETARLHVMSKERDSTMAILKKAAARAIAAKTRR